MSNSSGEKKIVIVSSWPLSEPVVRNRITPFLKLLLQADYDVCLVCPKHPGNKSQLYPGAKLHEAPLRHDKPKGFFSRALRETWNALILLRCTKNIQADTYLLTIPSMFLAFLAPLSLKKRKVVLDVRDLTWEYLSEDNLLQKISKKFFRFTFKRSLNFFRVVSVTNATELNYVKKIWRGNISPVLVSNGITRDQFESLAGVKANQSDLVSVAYIGNIGLAQRLETLVEAAKHLPDINFKVIGDGTDFDRISKLASDHKAENIMMAGRVSWEEIREQYNTIDILYAQLAPEYSGAMPSKLYEYLATGKYIIYGGNGQAAEILQGFSHHQLIPPCDVQALVSAIKAYVGGYTRLGISQSNREKVRAEYIREDAAEKLVALINEALVH